MMDKNTSNEEKVPVKCDICGEIIDEPGHYFEHITGRKSPVNEDFLKDIFRGRGDGKK